MSTIFHVNGPAYVYTNTGSFGAWEQLGASVDGVEISLNFFYQDVLSDIKGPLIPTDRQYMGETANIKLQLVIYDTTVLQKWLLGTPYGGNSEGTLGAIGNLVLQNDLTASLLVVSTPSGVGLTDGEPCWNFQNVMLVDSATQKVGTVKTVYDLTFYAIANQLSASFGAGLYTHNCEGL